MAEHRVVITGLGVVSPLGCNVDKLFSNLMVGKTNFSKPNNLMRKYEGGERLVSYVSEDYIRQCKRYGVFPEYTNVGYTILACKQAIENAGLDNKKEMLGNADLHIGTSESYAFDVMNYMKCPDSDVETYLQGNHPAENLSFIASELGLKGEVISFPVACSGGNVAISTCAKKIKYGYKDICIAGGVDHIGENSYSTFHCLGALSRTSCKPFDKDRDGITVGEGAGFLVLESLEHAELRGAKILAEVKGYNISCDAYHLTTPDINGIMASNSISKAMGMAGVKPQDISYISPHGTGTFSNDMQEANAIYSVFGSISSTIPVSAIKSMLGHCMGAASAIEAIVAACSIERNRIPETINVSHVDEAFPCGLMVNGYGERVVSVVLSTAFAFGGNISSVVFSKYR